jgi:hypothetical protein
VPFPVAFEEKSLGKGYYPPVEVTSSVAKPEIRILLGTNKSPILPVLIHRLWREDFLVDEAEDILPTEHSNFVFLDSIFPEAESRHDRSINPFERCICFCGAFIFLS